MLGHTGDATHLAFDRQRDVTFDFLGGLARYLGDHLNLDILHVREGLNRQIA